MGSGAKVKNPNAFLEKSQSFGKPCFHIEFSLQLRKPVKISEFCYETNPEKKYFVSVAADFGCNKSGVSFRKQHPVLKESQSVMSFPCLWGCREGLAFSLSHPSDSTKNQDYIRKCLCVVLFNL